MSNAIDSVTLFFDSPFGAAIKAILLLILAFIVAAIAKSLCVKLLSKTKLAESKYSVVSSGNTKESIITVIGKFVQLIVFLLFVPGIFEILGMTQVSTPILGMLQTVVGYIPNILACGVILWIGFYAAKLVRELLVPVFNKLQVNKLQTMAGIKVDDSGKLSNTLAYIVYVLILIPVIITALDVLDIRVISEPAIAMLQTIFNYIPSILAALIIITIGYILAKFIGNIVSRMIEASGLDAKVSNLLDLESKHFVLSDVVGKTIEVILVIFFVVESFSALHLGILTRIGVAIIAYMPYALTAFLILIACMFLAALATKALNKSGNRAMAVVVKYLIYVVGTFMILNELGIAKTLVDGTFIIAISALAVAFALSYGLGGRTFAKNTLAVLQKKLGIEDTANDADVKNETVIK